MRTAKRSWTASEQQLLEEMLAAKKSAAQIGLELNRNAEAVYARVQRLRLKSKSPHDRLSGLSFSRRSAAQTMRGLFVSRMTSADRSI
jgi:IS30 family transposase